MITIELDDEADKLLSQLMRQSKADASQLIKQALTCYLDTKQTDQAKQPELMTDIIATLPSLPTFAGDPLAIQQALRDEWH
jgi:predicted transcriptional regulator